MITVTREGRFLTCLLQQIRQVPYPVLSVPPKTQGIAVFSPDSLEGALLEKCDMTS